MTPPEVAEFSRPLSPENLGEQGRTLTIEAARNECDRLAGRLGLDGLGSLSAEFRLTPQKGGRIIRLEGTLKADITQTCVVTLESVETRIVAAFNRLYDTTLEAPSDGDREGVGGGEFVAPDGDDPPEPLSEGQIDIGEAVSEQLALEINPYPHKPEISFKDYSTGPDSGEPSAGDEAGDGAGDGGDNTVSGAGPFLGLAALKKKLKK